MTERLGPYRGGHSSNTRVRCRMVKPGTPWPTSLLLPRKSHAPCPELPA